MPAATIGETPSDIIGAIVDALPDPGIVLDRRSVVLHRNPAAAKDFPAALPGTTLTLSLRHPALLGALDAIRRTGEPQSVDLHQTVPNETWHRVHFATLPGNAGLLMLTLQNFTEQKRVESLRSDFIANASHELRTPLSSLVGFIDTLLGPAANDKAARERFLNIMRQQAGRMSALIDDMLSLNRIELRQHVRPTDRVELVRLLGEVKDGLETQARDAGVAVTLNTVAAAAEVRGDRNELYEVFENLLDNAIKYGSGGGKIEIDLQPAGRRDAYAFVVSVTDFGAGIAAEHVPRLTERFYRVDAESSRKKKGTGLGLAIVKHIVNRHHGLMTIRSRPGEGTRVEVLLPN